MSAQNALREVVRAVEQKERLKGYNAATDTDVDRAIVEVLRDSEKLKTIFLRLTNNKEFMTMKQVQWVHVVCFYNFLSLFFCSRCGSVCIVNDADFQHSPSNGNKFSMEKNRRRVISNLPRHHGVHFPDRQQHHHMAAIPTSRIIIKLCPKRRVSNCPILRRI